MSTESYKPTSEELRNAEATMEPEQVKLSEAREDLIKKVKQESGLEGDVFDQLAETYIYDTNEKSTTRRFTINRHNVLVESQFANGETIFTKLILDGVVVTSESSENFIAKYRRAIEGMDLVNNYKIARRSDEQVVEKALSDLV